MYPYFFDDTFYRLDNYENTNVPYSPYMVNPYVYASRAKASNSINEKNNTNKYDSLNKEILNLNNNSRKLFLDYIYLIKLLNISIVNNLSSSDIITNKLFKNIDNIEYLFNKYYSPIISKKVNSSIRNITIELINLFNAQKSNNENNINNANQKLNDIKDEFSTLLSTINPFWNKKQIMNLLSEITDSISNLSNTEIKKEYEQNFNIFNDIEMNVLNLADTFTQGITKQFIHKF